jgi:hypothetical protein
LSFFFGFFYSKAFCELSCIVLLVYLSVHGRSLFLNFWIVTLAYSGILSISVSQFLSIEASTFPDICRVWLTSIIKVDYVICADDITNGEKHVKKPKIWKNDTHSVRMTWFFFCIVFYVLKAYFKSFRGLK